MSDDKKKIHRVQVDFSEDAYEQLLKLKEDAGNDTVSALIRDALGFYSWFIEGKKRNAELLVRKDGEVEKIIFAETSNTEDLKEPPTNQ